MWVEDRFTLDIRVGQLAIIEGNRPIFTPVKGFVLKFKLYEDIGVIRQFLDSTVALERGTLYLPYAKLAEKKYVLQFVRSRVEFDEIEPASVKIEGPNVTYCIIMT